MYAQQQQQVGNLNFSSSSDSETSPAFSSAEYYSMMQQCAADEQMPNDISAGQAPQFQDQSQHGMSFPNGTSAHHHFGDSTVQRQTADMFDSPQEMNRRTLTQEQFDAFTQSSDMMHSSGQFDTLEHGFSGDLDAFQPVFPDMSHDGFKQQDAFAFPAPLGAPLSSNDSSVPSTISEQSMFPSSTAMQEHANLSATSSEWADSRSSSVSLSQNHDHAFHQMSVPATQPMATSSQWQPGQSVPVDPNALQQAFREASAQRQQQQAQAPVQVQNQVPTEQPLAWPTDEAYVRRDSQNGSMLAQQMNSFGLQTPQPPQSATFKSPAPPSDHAGSLAARRQRPRPAALPLASLRSQSYSGAAPQVSPSHPAAQNLAAPNQSLRRIRSSNVISGGVVQGGRVMKSTPGSAQRSPLAFTFAESMNSPKAARHASTSSTGNLAPPTPMSPSELPNRPTFPPWQSSSGQFSSRQASISETDAEHVLSNIPSANASSQNVSSPPHTPMFHHHGQQMQQFNQCRVGGNAITENTPPQSAPAAQQTFPSSVFMVPQSNTYGHPYQQSYQPQQPPQQFVNVPVPEQQFTGAPASFAPTQHFVVSASETQPAVPVPMPMQFANGVPIVDAQGNLTMGFPPQVQQMQFIHHPSQQGPPPQMQTPPQGGQYSFMATSGIPAGMAVTAQMPKAPSQPASEFFVHEYSPPQDMKQSATPRKAQTDGPKNYTFANQGPEHFEKEKIKKGSIDKTASSSPASASSC